LRTPPHPAYRATHADFDLAEVLGWSEESRAALKLSQVLRRAALSMWKRNAMLVVAGSDPARWSPHLVQALRRVAADEDADEWLRGAAREQLRRHGD
jgi:hypothetical protein